MLLTTVPDPVPLAGFESFSSGGRSAPFVSPYMAPRPNCKHGSSATQQSDDAVVQRQRNRAAVVQSRSHPQCDLLLEDLDPSQSVMFSFVHHVLLLTDTTSFGCKDKVSFSTITAIQTVLSSLKDCSIYSTQKWFSDSLRMKRIERTMRSGHVPFLRVLMNISN